MKQALTFVCIGALGAAINAGIYAALVLASLHYVAAGIIGWSAAVLAGYALNRRFTFKSTAPAQRTLPRVLAIYAAQQALALGGVAVMVEIFHVNEIAAYIVMMPAATVFSFIAMRVWGFRSLPGQMTRAHNNESNGEYPNK